MCITCSHKLRNAAEFYRFAKELVSATEYMNQQNRRKKIQQFHSKLRSDQSKKQYETDFFYPLSDTGMLGKESEYSYQESNLRPSDY